MKNIYTAFSDLILYKSERGISLSKQLNFYAPLAVTSMLMMTTNSFFNAALSRLPSPEIYIAAFALARSLLHIFESPLFMMRQAVSTLVFDARSYSRVKRFFLLLTLLTVTVMGILVLTGSVNWIYENIFGVEERVLQETVKILSIFMFFPAAVGFRNFLQGVAVKINKTILFTVSTSCSLIYVLLLILLVERLDFLPGAVFAGLMFLTAVTLEGLVIFIGIKFTQKDIPAKIEKMNRVKKEGNINYKLNYGYIFRFFFPLIITSFITMSVTPLVNIGLARSVEPEITISAYAVAWSLGWLLLSPGFMYHQLMINYYDKSKEKVESLKKFGFLLGLIISIIMILTAFSDLGYFVINNLIGASDRVTALSLDLLKLIVLFVPLLITREFCWGILIKENRTRFVRNGKLINLITLVFSMFILLFFSQLNAAFVGVFALLIAESMEVFYLKNVVKKSA